MDESMANPQFSSGMMIGFAVAMLLMVATVWRLFSKAGESGWKSLIPVYNAIVFQRILGRPAWWVVLMLVPIVNLAITIIECFDLARVYGKGVGYGLGLVLFGPLVAMILAFGPAQYVGPDGGASRRAGPKSVAAVRPSTAGGVVTPAPRKKAA